MLEIQKFLKNHSLDELKEKFGIKYRQHRDFNLYSLKYDQISSPMGEPIVQECRGIILDADREWAVVARPFDKFFNAGEGHAAPLDWSTARVQEKVDGSLAILYHYEGEWRVATSGTPDASGVVGGVGDLTFEKLFWNIFKDQNLPLPEGEEDCTFMFEMCSPYNRVVVRHMTSSLTLIGVRNRKTGIETKVHLFQDRYPVVKSYPISTLEGIISSFASIDPMCQEGFVVVDDQHHRQKIKHPGYVAIHHLKGNGVSEKQFLEIIRTGESSEFLTHFPEYSGEYLKVKGLFERLVEELETTYARIGHLQSQRDFALEAVKTRFSAPLFQHRKEGVSIRAVLAETSITGLMKALGLKE